MNRPRTEQTPDPAWQIQTLADSAKQLAARGEMQEAEKVYRSIIEIAPYHLKALYFLSTRAMEQSNLDEAEAMMERALRAAPDRPIVHQNLAMIHKARGHLEKAIESLDRATRLKPDFRTGFLHKGELLDKLGRRDEALAAFWQACGAVPTDAQLTDDSFAPPEYRPLVRRAASMLREAEQALIDEKLAPVQAKHGETALGRLRQMIDFHMGRRTPRYAHALQRPSYLYLPEVEPRAFFDRVDFPWVKELEAVHAVVRAELESALASGDGVAPYVQVDAENPGEWSELNRSPKWSSMHLLRGGKWNEENRARCPKTSRILESLPLAYIGTHAPEALFSILQPGTHIPPHHGLGNYKLVLHLPLIVPPDCSIRVGNETRSWKEGECLIFDDSFQHEAWNRSAETRTVLIVDIWNPLVTPAEREGMAALMDAMQAFSDRYTQPAA